MVFQRRVKWRGITEGALAMWLGVGACNVGISFGFGFRFRDSEFRSLSGSSAVISESWCFLDSSPTL